MNTYIVIFKSKCREHADMMRVEANDIWEANQKIKDYIKAHRRDYQLVTLQEISKLSFIK